MTTSTIKEKANLLGMTRAELRRFFEQMGEQSFRATQVMQWMHQQGVDAFDDMTNLGKALRSTLADVAEIRAPIIREDQLAVDGTRKWLLAVDDTNNIEMVFIPEGARGGSLDDPDNEDETTTHDEDAPTTVSRRRVAGRLGDAHAPAGRYRGTLCVSSQVGCTLNCAFCATGHQGFNRNLTVAEIVGQIWIANRLLGKQDAGKDRRSITNIVFMGMGEPLLNLDNVVKAIEILRDDFAYAISWRRITLSTAGLVPLIDELKERAPVSLAVSLHAPNDALRDKLVPLNRKYPIAELLAACRRYIGDDNRRRITFEYIMLSGVNDTPAHARELAALLRNVRSKINLIPYNPFPQGGFSRSAPATIDRFRDAMMAAGYVTVTRRTRGEDIDAACGQLAGRFVDRTRRRGRLPGTAAPR